jgi:cap1 methyltransferase
MNRAALKIANLDAILKFGLTSPKSKSGCNLVGELDLFYFADVCAGPGGFSE